MASSFELAMRFMDRFPLPTALEDLFLWLFRQAGTACTMTLDQQQRRATRAELQRMVRVFSDFRDAYKSPQLNKADLPVLQPFLQRTVEADNPSSLVWLIEGAGYRYGQWLVQGRTPGFSSDVLLSLLPARAVQPFYRGVGLYVGHAYAAKWERESPESGVVLKDFEALIEHNPELGTQQAFIVDSVGFLLRLIFPRLLRQIDAILQKSRPDLTHYLWFGAGRAIYFRFPRALYPREHGWLGVKRLPGEALRTSDLEGALAGLGFAVTLVNIDQPEFLEDFFRQHAEELSAGAGFSRGVREALDMWRSLHGVVGIFEALSEHEPRTLDDTASALWHSTIKASSEPVSAGAAPPKNFPLEYGFSRSKPRIGIV